MAVLLVLKPLTLDSARRRVETLASTGRRWVSVQRPVKAVNHYRDNRELSL